MTGFFVYILRCQDGSLYTGWTTNLERRFQEHNQGRASKYTRARLPVAPVYSESHASKNEALKREAAIKTLSRAQKEVLIASSLVITQ